MDGARPLLRRLADVVAEQGANAPGDVWVEGARDGRAVRRGDLAVVTAAWARSGMAGERLGLLAPDPVDFAVLFVALVAAGATVVPLDPRAPGEAQRALLATAGASRTVTTDPGATSWAPGDLLRVDPPRHLPPDGASPDRAAPDRAAPDRAAPDGTEGASLLFSSGSTGARKAIRLPEHQLLHVARAVARAHELGPLDRAFSPLPLFHVNAEVVALLAPLVSGGAAVLDDGFHRTGFWALVRQQRVTWLNTVPVVLAVLAGSSTATAGDDPVQPQPGLRFARSASAPLPVAVLERFERSCGVPVVETYGMTEAASQITANPLDDRRPGSVGVPVDVELRILGEDGEPVAAGTVGRVVLRGEGVITAYEGGLGADRFDADGWLDSGDAGRLDADGHLHLSGRRDDIVNRGGEKVFPREVEEVLRADERVTEAVVIGRADPVLGHVPVAYVTAQPDAPDDLDRQLLARCGGALPRAHRPVEVHVVPELPTGPTGKLARRLVAESEADLLAPARPGTR